MAIIALHLLESVQGGVCAQHVGQRLGPHNVNIIVSKTDWMRQDCKLECLKVCSVAFLRSVSDNAVTPEDQSVLF